MLHCADALAILPTLPSASFDLVICDPPYNAGVNYDSYFDDLPVREYRAWCGGWYYQCFRLTRRFLIVFPGVGNIDDWSHFIPSGKGMWHKPGSPHGGGSFRYGEYEPWLLWTRNGAWCSYSDVITAPLVSHGQKDTGGHPCPKPPKLYAEIVKRFIGKQRPAAVLDPFMGVGTMGVECAKLDIEFTGIEISPAYFAVAAKRIAAAKGESPGQLTRPDLFSELPDEPPAGHDPACDTAPASDTLRPDAIR